MKKQDPVNYFYENYSNIGESQLRDFHNSNPTSEGLTRFFNYMVDFVIGVAKVDIDNDPYFLLFYAEYKQDYRSISITVPIEEHRLSNDISAVLSKEVCIMNKDKDFFDIYNTFQYHRQSALEILGYFTYDPFTAPNGTLLTANQKIAPVEILDRVSVFKELYSETIDQQHLDPENKVYLMVDNRTGLIKIGKSKNPEYRERTLQSQEPETFLIAKWTAPSEIEKTLHKKYHELRKRGEWFKLGFKELDEIKEFMDNLY